MLDGIRAILRLSAVDPLECESHYVILQINVPQVRFTRKTKTIVMMIHWQVLNKPQRGFHMFAFWPNGFIGQSLESNHWKLFQCNLYTKSIGDLISELPNASSDSSSFYGTLMLTLLTQNGTVFQQ